MKLRNTLRGALVATTMLASTACDKLRISTAAQAEATLAANPITMTAQAYNDSLGYYRDRTDLNLSSEALQALVETRANLGSAGQELVDNLRSLPVLINNLKNSDASRITQAGNTELKVSTDYGNWKTMHCRSDGTIVFPGGQNTNHQYLTDCTVKSVVMDGGTLVVTIDGNLSEGVGGPRKDQFSTSTKTVSIGPKTLIISAGVYMVQDADASVPQNLQTP